jgi:hypothetical protein
MQPLSSHSPGKNKQSNKILVRSHDLRPSCSIQIAYKRDATSHWQLDRFYASPYLQTNQESEYKTLLTREASGCCKPPRPHPLQPISHVVRQMTMDLFAFCREGDNSSSPKPSIPPRVLTSRAKTTSLDTEDASRREQVPMLRDRMPF